MAGDVRNDNGSPIRAAIYFGSIGEASVKPHPAMSDVLDRGNRLAEALGRTDSTRNLSGTIIPASKPIAAQTIASAWRESASAAKRLLS
jgi:hypothetical protein